MAKGLSSTGFSNNHDSIFYYGSGADAFEAMMMREDCDTGFFVSFAYRSDAMTEIGQFFKRTGKMIRAFTVRDILDEEIAKKLA